MTVKNHIQNKISLIKRKHNFKAWKNLLHSMGYYQTQESIVIRELPDIINALKEVEKHSLETELYNTLYKINGV